MKSRTFAALFLSVIIIASAIAAPQVSKKSGGAAKTATAAPATAVAEVRVLDLNGLRKLLQRDAATETRPLLINFWATWCDPCREEFPDLVKIDTEFRSKGLDFIAISLDDPPDVKTKVPAFL